MSRILKKYLYWIFVNGGIAALLLFGNEGFFNFAIILLWLTAIIGCIFLSKILCKAVIKEHTEANDGKFLVVNIYITYAYDITMTLYLAYIGHPILAVVYAMHILGIKQLHEVEMKSFADKLKDEKATA